MPVDLSEYVESLKREVVPLGSTLFSGITEAQWTGFLADAFWEAKLDGFLNGFVADEDGIVTSESSGELDRRYVALVVLYAGIRIIRNRILSLNTSFRAKAGPVEYEQENSANVMTEMLKQLRATKDRILEELDELGAATEVRVLDAFSARMFNPDSYYGSPEMGE